MRAALVCCVLFMPFRYASGQLHAEKVFRTGIETAAECVRIPITVVSDAISASCRCYETSSSLIIVIQFDIILHM